MAPVGGSVRRLFMRLGLIGPGFMVVAGILGPPASAVGLISDVSVSPPFFNPTVGQKEAISFTVADRGDVTVSILDRDLVPIRILPSLKGVSGRVGIEWDGRDGAGHIAPDEAYTVRIVCACGKGLVTYAPAVGFKSTLSEPKRTYSMASGVIRYELDGPSRVHIQAGQAALLPNGKRAGPVLRTVVDREPRSGGAVAEQFDGLDVTKTIFLPSLRDFAVSITAESLPPTSVITVGNRGESFRRYASMRREAGPARVGGGGNQGHGEHHQGLTSLEDHTPLLTLAVPGTWDADGRVRLRGKPFEVRVDMSRDEAIRFMRPDALLMVFLDEKTVLEKTGLTPPALLTVDPRQLSPGEHRLAVNWVSPYGPVGVSVTRVLVEPPAPATAGVSR
jgi:hypothetical protein